MSCPNHESFMAYLVDGESNQHIETCPSCQAKLAKLKASYPSENFSAEELNTQRMAILSSIKAKPAWSFDYRAFIPVLVAACLVIAYLLPLEKENEDIPMWETDDMIDHVLAPLDAEIADLDEHAAAFEEEFETLSEALAMNVLDVELDDYQF